MDLSERFDAIAYRAALAAARELPERVRNFALEASGRTDPQGRPIKIISSRDCPEPWPDGPVLDPDQEFSDLVLTTDAVYPLILHAPDVASEVLLASLPHRAT